jgi:hypothetical protein
MEVRFAEFNGAGTDPFAGQLARQKPVNRFAKNK